MNTSTVTASNPLQAATASFDDDAASISEMSSVTPDALMAYCQSRLDSIDGQITDSFNSQSQTASTINVIDQVAGDLRNYGSDQTDPNTVRSIESEYQQAIQTIQATDPGSPALAKLIPSYNQLVYSGDGGAAFVAQKNGTAVDPTAPDFIDETQYAPQDNSTQGDGRLSATELEAATTTLTDAASDLNSSTELAMVNLQSLMSQRQTAISLTTNLVQSLGDQLDKIADNIGK